MKPFQSQNENIQISPAEPIAHVDEYVSCDKKVRYRKVLISLLLFHTICAVPNVCWLQKFEMGKYMQALSLLPCSRKAPRPRRQITSYYSNSRGIIQFWIFSDVDSRMDFQRYFSRRFWRIRSDSNKIKVSMNYNKAAYLA